MEKKYKTTWDLSALYASPKDPKIEKDLALMERLYKAFEKKYKGKTDYLKNEKKLLAALEEYRGLTVKTGHVHPYTYTHLAGDLDSSDEVIQKLTNTISERITKNANHVLFFPLSLGKITKPLQQKFLKSKSLVLYHYFLKGIFDRANHNLSESEEKILNLTSLSAYDLWVRGVEKNIGEKTVLHNGEQIPLAAAQNIVRTLPTQEERHALAAKVTEKLKEAADFSTAEINAVYLRKKMIDELRGYKKPYSATLLGHQISEKTLNSLRIALQKYQKVSHDFYTLKAKLLNIDTLKYSDRSAQIGKTEKTFSFEESVDVIARSLEKVGDWYKDTFLSFLKNGQVDVFPRKGKRNGAYCWGDYGRPTYVLLNHTNDLYSVMTYGHEMGHAFHSELSKKQDVLYQDYSTAVAEVASTLFENVVFEEVEKSLSAKEKIIALHDRISDDVQTIHRQIACFNFELELHETIRAKGGISTEEILTLMNKHMQSYLGPAFKLVPDDAYLFVSWSHIRRFFYVYSYAYGQLISKALYAKYKQDPTFWKKIEQFLSAGGSKSPEHIFKDIGIDTSKPGFFETGLKSIAKDIETLRELAKKEGMIQG